MPLIAPNLPLQLPNLSLQHLDQPQPLLLLLPQRVHTRPQRSIILLDQLDQVHIQIDNPVELLDRYHTSLALLLGSAGRKGRLVRGSELWLSSDLRVQRVSMAFEEFVLYGSF
jgi:hypothetical protein